VSQVFWAGATEELWSRTGDLAQALRQIDRGNDTVLEAKFQAVRRKPTLGYMMVQSAQNWHGQHMTGGLDGTGDRRVLLL
jgi:hypothetical protein